MWFFCLFCFILLGEVVFTFFLLLGFGVSGGGVFIDVCLFIYVFCSFCPF